MTLQGQRGGVTQVQWSPDGNYLYTGGRRDGEILCWDVRHSSDVVYRCTRASEGTNQRIGRARLLTHPRRTPSFAPLD